MKWTAVKRLKSEHRIFASDGRFALCDQSGANPEESDDGILWLDPIRPLKLGLTYLTIPLLRPAHGTEVPCVATALPADLIPLLHILPRWLVQVGDDARLLHDLVDVMDAFMEQSMPRAKEALDRANQLLERARASAAKGGNQ